MGAMVEAPTNLPVEDRFSRHVGLVLVEAVLAEPRGTDHGPEQTTDRPSRESPALPPRVSRPGPGGGTGYAFPSAGQRVSRYLDRAVGPGAWFSSAARAAVDHAGDEPGEWEQGAEGYGKRFGSRLGLNFLTETTRYGVSESLRLDLGYEPCGCKGFFRRFGHALKETLVARRPNDATVADVSAFVSPYAGAMIGVHSWYPERFSWKDGLRIGTRQLATEPARNLLREFFPGLFR